jgi:hypothetical protein
VQDQLEPVDQFAGGRLLLEAGHVADIVEDVHRTRHQALLDVGKVDVDNRLHRLPIGKLDIVEEASAQESVGQLLFII